MKQILICGDSFAADWSPDYPNCQGWPNQLGNVYQITNLAQAGCSEYRIYKQLKSAQLSNFDLIIVSHTSPYRIYAEHHPGQTRDKIHTNCDLLFSDIEHLAKTNSDYKSVEMYFKKFFSLEYAEFSYDLLVKEIYSLLANYPTLHVTHQQTHTKLNWADFSDIYSNYPGLINHYSDIGNQKVFDKLIKLIKTAVS